ncbi:MAG: hypothetical protein HDR86_06565 [Bacteroides sp.]|nr:hypothetical protein [Bacteroides sp.]
MSPARHSPLIVEVTGSLAFSVFAEAADRNPPFHSFMSHISISESLNSPKKKHIPLDFLRKRAFYAEISDGILPIYAVSEVGVGPVKMFLRWSILQKCSFDGLFCKSVPLMV